MKKLIMIALLSMLKLANASDFEGDWYILPEKKTDKAFGFLPWSDKKKAEKKVVSLLETIKDSSVDSNYKMANGQNKYNLPNWTPWHLEVISTELSLSTSGLIGILTGKGTATARAFWRRQGEKKPQEKFNQDFDDDKSIPTLQLEKIQTIADLENELNPMIYASLKTGMIKDEANFRKNLINAAKDFYFLTEGLQGVEKKNWWLGRMRLDLVVSASGKISAAPLASVGAEVRLRFDWRRLMKKEISKKYAFTPNQNNFLETNIADAQLNFAKLVSKVSNDLSSTFDEDFEIKGLRPFQFRVGLGISASGHVGIAKSSASAIAHLYFNRDQKMPTVYPAKKLNFVSDLDDGSPILLIDNTVNEEQVSFAKANNIEHFYDFGNKFKSIFKVDRNNFRKGIEKSLKMGKFFATASLKTDSRNWKLYEMRTGFEMSLTGTVGLATVGGLMTTQVNFINTNF